MISITEGQNRVLIAHYRVGMTDGVSLEIEKRRHILEKDGFDVRTLAGPGSRNADFVLPSLDFDSPPARRIAENAFGGLTDYAEESDLMADISRLAARVEEELEEVFHTWKPDFLLLHNIFSHGRHIASAAAFRAVLARSGCRALATHHDFYWERDAYRYPSGPAVRAFLEMNVPPELPQLKHAVINSLAAAQLKERTGIDAMVFPDTLDFDAAPWTREEGNAALPAETGFSPGDIIVLQATRIVRRKGIELIVPVLKRLNSPAMLERIRGRELYNGKRVSREAHFFYVIAGYAEQDAVPYRRALENLLAEEGIPHSFISSRIGAERRIENDRTTWSLFDVYPWADLVSYPSRYEGWGNQFLEAVFARKPIMIFEYPVFKTDIRDRGYGVISMGDRADPSGDGDLYSLPEPEISRIAEEVLSTLLNPDTRDVLDMNFRIGRNHNSYETLEALMAEGMAIA